MEGVLEALSENASEVIPMTSDDGIQFKVFAMHAFSHDSNQIYHNNFFKGETLTFIFMDVDKEYRQLTVKNV